MATVNKIFMPHRGTSTVMDTRPTLILQKGELFIEGPVTGIGRGHHKIKIGDGVTQYSDLPYALGDTDADVTSAHITFSEDSSTDIATAISHVTSGNELSILVAGLKKAIALTAAKDVPSAAFTSITNGTTTISATSTDDTLSILAGTNVSLAYDTANKSIRINSVDNNTTYDNVSTAAAGLMTAADKIKLDGISANAKNVSVQQIVQSGTELASISIDGTPVTIYGTANTDTHYNAKQVVAGYANATENTDTALTNGNVFMNIVENNEVRSSHNISGSGATEVRTDANGNIIIGSTDNNTTYDVGTSATAGITKLYSDTGSNTDGTMTQSAITAALDSKLGSGDVASMATADADGQNISQTYVKGISISGRVLTVTKGDGSTATYNTQDNNTTYSAFTGATSDTEGSDGLVPAPAVNDQNSVLMGSSVWRQLSDLSVGNASTAQYATNANYAATAGSAGSATNADTATYAVNASTSAYASAANTATLATNASSAAYAGSATNADTATYAKNATSATYATDSNNALFSTRAKNDNAGNDIRATYISNITVDGHTVSITKGDGSTSSFNTADNNTTYSAFTGASTASGGSAGLVPAPSAAQVNFFLKANGSWSDISGISVSNATNADTATYAVNAGTSAYANNASTSTVASKDTNGANILSYIKTITYSDHTVTITAGDGSIATFDTADNNTTYTTATANNSGLTKLYSSDGTAVDGTMTRTAITTFVNGVKEYLEQKIGQLNSFEVVVIPVGEYLPEEGVEHTIYFLPEDENEETGDISYAEYIWIDGYYEKIGMTKPDLAGYYTAAETDTAIETETNDLVESISYSGHTVTITKKGGSTATFDTADNNTTYDVGGANSLGLTKLYGDEGNNTDGTMNQNAITTALAGKLGTTDTASAAVEDSVGQDISQTYIKDIDYSDHTLTFTKGDGTTSSFDTADNNTTYATFTGASAEADGTTGLVPAPSTAEYSKFLRGNGTWVDITAIKVNNAATADYAVAAASATSATNASTADFASSASNAGTADYATNSGTATYASNAGTATYVASTPHASTADYATTAASATSATNASTADYASNAGTATVDSAGQNISQTYVKNIEYAGHTVTFTKGDGSTASFATADNNTTYTAFTGATADSDGTAGLVIAPTTADREYFLKGDGTWSSPSETKVNNAGTADYATNAGTATFATSATSATNAGTATYAETTGNVASATNSSTAEYAVTSGDSVSTITRNGLVFTVTKADGSTFSFDQTDSNTTYTSFVGATDEVDGTAGLVPAPSTATKDYFLKGDGSWTDITSIKVNSAGSADSATNAGTATYAANAGTTTYSSTAGSAACLEGNGTTVDALVGDIMIDFGFEG